jgi:anti-sigma factor RsiW
MVSGMECRENAELLPGYAAGELDADVRARFERHTETCAACREAAERQMAIWSSLDAWETPAISPDFDARLARRIENETGWWKRTLQALRPALIRRGLPIAAAAGLAITAAIFLDHSARVRTPQAPGAQVETIRADQQESVVEDMQLLQEFNGLAHPDAADSSM